MKIACILLALFIGILAAVSAGAAEKPENTSADTNTQEIDVPSAIDELAEQYASTIPKVKPQDGLKLPYEGKAPPEKKRPFNDDITPISTSGKTFVPKQPTASARSTTPPPSGYPVFPIALINNGAPLTQRTLDSFADALQTQVNHDFLRYWRVAATVVAYNDPADWPGNSWPIFIDGGYCPDCGGPGNGYHFITSDNTLPYAEVQYGSNWPVAVSHEMLEMIENPGVMRVVKYGRNPTYNYYVEVSDPVQGATYSYWINGWPVSDYVGPNYFAAYYPRPYDFEDIIRGWLHPLCYGYQEYYVGPNGADHDYFGPCPNPS